MVAALGIHMHFQTLERTMRERHPELAERVRFHVTASSGGMDPVLNSEPTL